MIPSPSRASPGAVASLRRIRPRRSGAPRRALALAAAALLLAGGLALYGPSLPEPPGEVRLSLLAVGDTGVEPGTQDGRQQRVGEALAAEDRRRPADALLLLGDNFYPDGLRAQELEERVRFNLVRPYCRFVALTGPRSERVADACPPPPEGRPPERPLLAVLGNHDYGHPESPRLQREAIPRFIANWRLPDSPAEVVELGRGVSLILVDSPLLYREAGATAALRRALERARGPWRILAMHHPLVPVEDEAAERAFQDGVREVLRAHPERRVQLVVTGHEHNLAVMEMEEPYAYLHAVAGAGGGALREVEVRHPGLRLGAEEPGFVRIDLVEREGQEHLRLSVLAATGWGILREGGQRLGVWSVDLRGRVRSEAPPSARAARVD